MKKFLSAVLVCVMLLSCVLVLASCGNTLSGTYEDESGLISYTFKGKDVEAKIFGVSVEGTYKIDGDTITFEFEGDIAEEFSGESDFNKGSDSDGQYIEIDGVKLYKQ